MSLAQIRRRCASQIDSLQLPDQVSVAAICEQVAAFRGRPIRILTHTLLPPDKPCGLRIATPQADYLVVQDGAVPAHRDLILLHEVGHVLLDPDDTGSPLDEDLLKALLPHVDQATVTCMLTRGQYTLETEQAAETFATLLWGRTSGWAPGMPRAAAPGANDAVDRIERALERGRC